MLPVETPFKVYTGRDGKPLNNGYVYFGVANQNPITAPVTVYWDAAGTQQAFQPLRTENGYIMRSGTPANVFVAGAYSELVQDQRKRQVFYARTSDEFSAASALSSLFSGSTGSSLIGFLQTGASAVVRAIQSKLRDTISVKDFGVKGDGTTDDRNAINTMLGNLLIDFSKCEVEFPRGDYLLNSNLTFPAGITLRFQQGARLVIPNGVTVTLTRNDLKAGRQQVFSCTGTGVVVGTVANDLIFPEWWGAIADGLHPPVGLDFSARAAAAARNGPALQAALTFAGYSYPTNGLTGTVSLTYGFYVFAPTLSIPLSVNLIGYGIGSALFYYAATGNALEMVATNNSLVSDIFLAPIAGPTWNFTTGMGLRVDNVSTCIVRNVWSSGFGGSCFHLLSAIESRFYGLVTDNANGNAFTLRGIGQGSVLEACNATNTDIGIDFDIQSGYDWHLIGCTSKNQRATALQAFYMNAVENITLTACGAHDSKREGILMTSSTLNCTINGCFVNGASLTSAGTYSAMNISGQRHKLIAPKVTQNAPTYNYALTLGGGATDCSYTQENFTAGTVGAILDGQPTGSNTSLVRKVTTTNATPLNVWAKALNNNAGVLLEAMVVAKQRGNAASAVYKFWVHATTGTVSTALVSGPTSIYSYESAPLLDATFVLTSAAANAGVVSLQITGLAALPPIDWEATVTAISITG